MIKRIKYIKDERLKFISHLDTMRVFARAMRRGRICVAYSRGFNPHPVMSFVMPLSLSFVSECEFADIDFDCEVPDGVLIGKFNAALPDGLRVVSVSPPVMKAAAITAAEYDIETDGNISSFFEQSSFVVNKKSKKGFKDVDIMPYIYSYKICGNTVTLKLAAGNEMNLNPEVVMAGAQKFYDKDLTYNICRRKIFAGEEEFC